MPSWTITRNSPPGWRTRAGRRSRRRTKLIAEALPFYWASGSIHSPETGSPEMLMELAYRLAVEESPLVQNIRKNSIVLITPVSEADGRDRAVDVYNYRKANPGKTAPTQIYWGKYVAHDNNRDGLGMALALSRTMMSAFLEYHPTVLHDLHESQPFLYVSTGMGPYNAWLDPLVIDEWQKMAYVEIEEMTKRGVPGVWTHGYYDGWAPNYMFYVANGHNSIGRFYETFGGVGADTGERTVPANATSRTWYRPNPPLPRVNWSLRNNINLQQSALLFSMNNVAANRKEFLGNFYLKSKRSVDKAKNEGPAAWVIPGDDPRPAECAEVVNLLRLQGVEVQRLDERHRSRGGAGWEEAEVPRRQLRGPHGSALQPHGGHAARHAVLQCQRSAAVRRHRMDPGPAAQHHHGARRQARHSASVHDAAGGRGQARRQNRGTGGALGPAAYLINHNADNTLATFRFKLKDVKMFAAEEAFKAEDRGFAAGSFIIKTEGNPGDLRARLESAAAALGIAVYASAEVPKVAMHELAAPRIALVHTWTNTQNEGWFRVAFDRLQIPYDYISDQKLRATANLRDKWDVILFGPVGGTAQRIVNGLPMRGDPMPWKKTDLTPNLGGSPDTTDDMRGGMGLEGLVNVARFIDAGGLFITITGNASIPIDYGIIEGVAIASTPQLRASGSVINAVVADKRSPIAYGYGDKLAVYFNQSPVFSVRCRRRRRAAERQAPTVRPAAGPLTDPDIPQGRPLQMASPPAREPGRARKRDAFGRRRVRYRRS